MAIQQVSRVQRTQELQQANVAQVHRTGPDDSQTVPLGPTQERQAEVVPGGVTRPDSRNVVPTGEQIVARRAAMVLGQGRNNVLLKNLKPHEIKTLARTQVGRQEASQVHRALRRQARACSLAWSRSGNQAMASVAASLSRTPVPTEPMSLYEALAAMEASNRLRQALGAGDFFVDQSTPNAGNLEQTPDGALISEFYLSFTHDLMSMVGPEFEPSGFKFYLSPDTPATDNSNAIRTIDVPLVDEALIEGMQANAYNVYFGEVDSDLDPSTQYYLWATAYNSDGESIHSNYVYKVIRAGERGDLNADGVINMIDVNLMLDILLDGSLPYARADINQDGENTQEDLEILIDMVNQ